jgi:S-adenosylmethionine decarboxylase
MHLVIDGYGGDQQKMWDAELLRSFLAAYPAKLGMTRMSEPQTSSWSEPDPGISGFVVIAESHICIHTFPTRDYVNIDIFSCKNFDHEQALADVRELYSLSDHKSWLLERGLEFLNNQRPMETPLEAVGVGSSETTGPRPASA